MSGFTTAESQFKLVGPDGTTHYIGAGKIVGPREVTNDAAAAMLAGEGVIYDNDSVIARFDTVAAGGTPATDIPQTEVLKATRIAAATDGPFLGVTLGAIAVAKQGVVASDGSVLCVQCIDPPTSNTVRSKVIGSSTAGKVNATAANAVDVATGVPAGGTLLGRVLKPAGTGAGQTGSATQLGIIIAIW